MRNPLRAYLREPLVFCVYGAGDNRGGARFYPAFQNEAPRARGLALDIGPVGITMPRKGNILALRRYERREVFRKFSASVAGWFYVSVRASVTGYALGTLDASRSDWSGKSLGASGSLCASGAGGSLRAGKPGRAVRLRACVQCSEHARLDLAGAGDDVVAGRHSGAAECDEERHDGDDGSGCRFAYAHALQPRSGLRIPRLRRLDDEILRADGFPGSPHEDPLELKARLASFHAEIRHPAHQATITRRSGEDRSA